MHQANASLHKILVVDDEEDQRESLRLILELKGYSVDTAENGERALDQMRAGELPCVVLLDLMMPIMDGWKFWNEVSRDERLASVPVIVMSGVAQFPAARAIDAVAHLNKPVEISRLYRVVAQYCDHA